MVWKAVILWQTFFRVRQHRQVSFLQHEPYSWEVLGADFVRMDDVDEGTRFLNDTVRTWLAGRSLQERNEFVDAVFELLTLGEIDDLRDVILPRNVLRYLRTLSTDEELRSIIAREFAQLIKTAAELRRKKDVLSLPESN